MKLDQRTMDEIRYLEHEYGQLSEVPGDNHLIIRMQKRMKKSKSSSMGKSVNFLLSKEDKQKLEALANKQETPMSVHVRAILLTYINKPYEPIEINRDNLKDRVYVSLDEADYNQLSKVSKKYEKRLSYLLSRLITQELNQ